MADQWNSVEIATLAVAAVTPVTVAVVGYFVARASKRLGHVQWANQTVLTRRLEIFNQVAPHLNQLLCFATFVGGWPAGGGFRSGTTRSCTRAAGGWICGPPS
jgi:hypothetical protein